MGRLRKYLTKRAKTVALKHETQWSWQEHLVYPVLLITFQVAFVDLMNNPALQQVLTESRTRLEIIAKRQGINLNIIQQPLITPDLRGLCDVLALCPDDAAAERAVKRHVHAVAGFLFASRDIAGAFESGRYTNCEVPNQEICPYFYISRYVSSQIDMIDDFMREKREEEGND